MDPLVYLGVGDEVYLVLDQHHGDVPTLLLHLPPPPPDGQQGGAVCRREGEHTRLGVGDGGRWKKREGGKRG